MLRFNAWSIAFLAAASLKLRRHGLALYWMFWSLMPGHILRVEVVGETFKRRLAALEKKVAAEGVVLTEATSIEIAFNQRLAVISRV